MNERSIFLQALEIGGAAERTKFLNAACGDDPELRSRVEQLLQSYSEAGSFLRIPALEQSGASHGMPLDPTQTQAAQDTPGDRSDSLHFLQPSQRPDSLGRLDHYEVLEVVGRGGMGLVLRAFDEKLHRVVAIKMMASDIAASGPGRKRFSREARAAAAVVHDHIVPIHGIHDSGTTPFLVMQFIEGKSLQQKIDDEGSLELKEILRIGRQIALGLAAAHQQGLVHRDIKPSNILLENGVQRVKITDFGLARVADDASDTHSGVIAGTPQFMSPEQAEGKPVDHRSDLFSLGSVMYAMCAGRPPFRADSALATLKRVCEDTPRPIREVNPDVPEWLSEIIAKLHAKKPEERFQSAKEVAELLEQRLAQVQQSGQESVSEMTARAARIGREPASEPAWVQVFEGTDRNKRLILRGVVVAGAVIVAGTGILTVLAGASLLIVLLAVVFFVVVGAVVQFAEMMKEKWEFDYKGRRIRFETSGLKGEELFLDGVSIAGGAFGSPRELRATIPSGSGAGDAIRVVLDDGFFSRHCRVFVGLAESKYSRGRQAGNTSQTAASSPRIGAGGWLGIAIVLLSFLLAAASTVAIWPGHLQLGWGLLYLVSIYAVLWLLVQARIYRPRESFRHAACCASVLGVLVILEIAIGATKHRSMTDIIFGVPASGPMAKLYVETDDDTINVEIDHHTPKISKSETTTTFEWELPEGMHVLRANKRGQGLVTGYFQTIQIGWGQTQRLNVSFQGGEWLVRPIGESNSRPGPLDGPGSAKGFVSLFNGRELSGWEILPAGRRDWQVKNGILVGRKMTNDVADATYLFTRQEFANFHLRAEVRINSNGHGDISFRGSKPTVKEPWPHAAYRALINTGDQRAPITGSLKTPSGTSVELNGNGPSIPNDAWFTYEVIAEQNHIVLKINGGTVLDHRWEDANDKPHAGPIALGLPDNLSVVEFRKIEIKELPPSESAWTQLFNGRDHTGWHPVGGGREFRTTIADGVLRCPGVTYLITDAVYENYELAVEYRYTKAHAGGEFAIFPMMEEAPFPFKKTQIARIYDDGHGEVYSEFGAKSKETKVPFAAKVKVPGEWNRMTIRAVNDEITVYVNDVHAATLTGCEPRKGHIGLWTGNLNGDVEVRSIRIRPCDRIDPKDISAINGQPKLLKAFDPAKEKALPPRGNAKNVTAENGAWRIVNDTNTGNFNVLLATVRDSIPEDGVIICRAKIKVEAKEPNAWGDLRLGDASPSFFEYDWPDSAARYEGQVTEWTTKEVRYPASLFVRSGVPSVPIYVGLHANGVLWVKDLELLHLPAPAGPPPFRRPGETVVKTFTFKDRPITKEQLFDSAQGWRFTAEETRQLRLFEIRDADVKNCRLIFRAKMKTEQARGIYLRMIVRFPGEEGALDTEGRMWTTAEGDTNWTTYEVTIDHKSNERPELIQLNAWMTGRDRSKPNEANKVWIKDVELLKAPLPKEADKK